MRSRPRVDLELSPERPAPGATLKIKATLHSRSATPCDAIYVGLIGREKRFKRRVRADKTTYKTYYERTVISVGAVAPGRLLTPGAHPFSVEVELPSEGLPPTYESDFTTIGYEVVTKVEIPWWPDKEAWQPIELLPAETVPAKARGVHVVTHPEPTGSELFVEVSLPRSQYAIQDRVEGTLSLWNRAHHRLKAIEIDVIAIESPLLESDQGPVVIAQTSTVELPPPADGEAMPFRVDLTSYLPPGFESEFIRVDHQVRVRCVISFGRDVVVHVPISVIRPRRRILAPAALPAVGDQRARAAWTKVLAELATSGVEVERASFDDGTLRLKVEDVPIEIAVERHGPTPRTTATIDYPDLGLELRVVERSWTDLGRGLALPRPYDQRFRASAREVAQAEQLLRAELLEALARANEAALDDDAAVLSFDSALRTRTGVREVLGATVEFARRMRRAIDALPPPRALAGSLAAYRAFADAQRATLRVGDMSLSGLQLRGVACGLRQRLEGEALRGSELLVYLPRGVSPTPEQLSRLGEATRLSASLSEGVVALELAPIADPHAALPAWEAAADAVLSWAQGGRGPYRR